MSVTQAYRRTLDKLLADYRHAGRCVVEEKQALASAKEQATATLEAQQVVQAIAQQIQQQVHGQIASLVTKCLQTIFGEDAYELYIDFLRERGKTSAHLWFVRDGQRLDPLDATGGGVVDVAAMALRLAVLLLHRPPLRRLLILDEPFRFLSKEYRPAVRELLLSLAKELDVQIIMVTHSPEFVMGKVVDLGEMER